MITFYVDESGSMKCNVGHDFIIAMVEPFQKERLKRVYKRFVSENIDRLRALDGEERRMFDGGGSFREMKGSQMDARMKRDFLEFFTRRDRFFQVHFIRIDNDRAQEYFYRNKSRAFNYVIKLYLQACVHAGLLPADDVQMQIDERNVRTESKNTLEDYLNTEIMLANGRNNAVSVQYFASECNAGIQVADVFANLYAASLRSGQFAEELRRAREAGFLRAPFLFPNQRD